MKKWVSLLLSASLAVAMPVSAFANGSHGKSDVHVKVKGHENDKLKADGKMKVDVKEKWQWKDKTEQKVKADLKAKLEEKVKADLKAKLEQQVKADAKIKVKANVDSDHKGDDDGEHGDMHAKIDIKLDGIIDSVWKNAEKIAFKDAATGLDGYCRFMWDQDNLYLLVELKGAAKLWKESNKPVAFALWYNGDEEVKGAKGEDGFVVVTWPDMTVRHDNGLHLGWFKSKLLAKSFAVNGDDVNLEMKLPWVNSNGMKLTENTELGLCIKLKELGVIVPDANGKFTINLTEQQIKDLKGDLTKLPLQLVGGLVGGVSDNGNVGGGTGNTGGTGNSGGTGSGGGTGTGGATSPSSGGTDVTITPAPVTAVKGVSDSVGVIPAGMPKTGGGGASEWTD